MSNKVASRIHNRRRTKPSYASPVATKCETAETSRIGDRSRLLQNHAQESPLKNEWKSLFDGKTLAGWKTPQFGGEGKVYVENGSIVMEMGSYMTGITWTGEVLRNNYELSLEGMKLEGTDFFCTTTFPVGDDPCTLVVGGWGGGVVGLSNVDGHDASDNSTIEDTWRSRRINGIACESA